MITAYQPSSRFSGRPWLKGNRQEWWNRHMSSSGLCMQTCVHVYTHTYTYLYTQYMYTSHIHKKMKSDFKFCNTFLFFPFSFKFLNLWRGRGRERENTCMYTHTHAYITCMQIPMKSKRATDFPKAGDTGGCQLSTGSARNWTQVLWKNGVCF